MIGHSVSKNGPMTSFLVYAHLIFFLIMGAPMHLPSGSTQFPISSPSYGNLVYDFGNDVAPAGFSVFQTAEPVLGPVWRHTAVPVLFFAHQWSCNYEPVTCITNHIVPNIPNPQQAPAHRAATLGSQPNAVPFPSDYLDERTRGLQRVTRDEKNYKRFGNGPSQQRGKTKVNLDGAPNASLGRPQVATVPSVSAGNSAVNHLKVANREKTEELIAGPLEARPRDLDQDRADMKGQASTNFLKNNITPPVDRVVDMAAHTPEQTHASAQNKETRVPSAATRVTNTSSQPQNKHEPNLVPSKERANTVTKEKKTKEGTTDFIQKSISSGCSSNRHKIITDAVSNDGQKSAQGVAAVNPASTKGKPLVNENNLLFPPVNRENVESNCLSEKRTSEFPNDREATIIKVSSATELNAKQNRKSTLPLEGNVPVMKASIKSTQIGGKDLVAGKFGTSIQSARNQLVDEKIVGKPINNPPQTQASLGSTENGIHLVTPAGCKTPEHSMNKNDVTHSNEGKMLDSSHTALNGNQSYKNKLSTEKIGLMKETLTKLNKKGHKDSIQVKDKAMFPIQANKYQPDSKNYLGLQKHRPEQVLTTSPSRSENGMSLETPVPSSKSVPLKGAVSLNSKDAGVEKQIQQTQPILQANTVNPQDNKQSLNPSSSLKYTDSNNSFPVLTEESTDTREEMPPSVGAISAKKQITEVGNDTSSVIPKKKKGKSAKKGTGAKNESARGPEKVQAKDLDGTTNPQIDSILLDKKDPLKETPVPKNEAANSRTLEGGIPKLREDNTCNVQNAGTLEKIISTPQKNTSRGKNKNKPKNSIRTSLDQGDRILVGDGKAVSVIINPQESFPGHLEQAQDVGGDHKKAQVSITTLSQLVQVLSGGGVLKPMDNKRLEDDTKIFNLLSLAFHPGSSHIDENMIFPGIQRPSPTYKIFEANTIQSSKSEGDPTMATQPDPTKVVTKGKGTLEERVIEVEYEKLQKRLELWDPKWVQTWKKNKLDLNLMDSLSRHLNVQDQTRNLPLSVMELDTYQLFRDIFTQKQTHFMTAQFWVSQILGFKETEHRVRTTIKQIAELTILENWKIIKNDLLNSMTLTKTEVEQIESFYNLSKQSPNLINHLSKTSRLVMNDKQDVLENIKKSLGLPNPALLNQS